MNKIFFRVDGNERIGLGHLTRSIALGCMLVDSFEVTFFCKDISDNFQREIKRHGFACFKVNNEDQFLKVISPETIVVLDGYDFNITYQKKIKAIGCKLVCIDDLHDQEFVADLIVNHAPGIKLTDYMARPYTKYALGLEFALMRPSFLAAAMKVRNIHEFNTAFICFGGSDPLNLTFKAVSASTQLKKVKKINVVIGGSYQHKEIFEFAKETDVELNIYQDINELQLAELMNDSHFAVASASTISYEVCCVKMPFLCGYYVENQKLIYDGLLKHDVILGGGYLANYSAGDFKKKIDQLLSDKKSSLHIEKQSALFDSEIKKRMVKLFLNISPKAIIVRRAEEKDVDLLYIWTNDELVRQQSYSSEKISMETHVKWFKKKIADVNALIYIFEVDGMPAGVVRIENKNENALIGISVDQNFRKQDLAPKFLKKAVEEYFQFNDRPIMAFIKSNNTASVRAFEKAGFVFNKEIEIDGVNSLVYRLDTYLNE